MKNTYFHRVHETQTRFWINNPTLEQAKLPSGRCDRMHYQSSYVSKLFLLKKDRRVVNRAIDLLAI